MLYITPMTTEALIKELQNADPSGKLDVTIGKTPIHFVEEIGAYYDGCLQRLVHDQAKAPYYDIVAGVITSKGSHITIHTLSIEDAILDNPTLPVTFDLEGEGRIKYYKEMVDGWRSETMMVIEKLDVENMEKDKVRIRNLLEKTNEENNSNDHKTDLCRLSITVGR